MRILVTGGTAFVSRAIVQHYVKLKEEVYVLNRGNLSQITGVHHLKYDRHQSFDLKSIAFDVVIDVTAYTGNDVRLLLEGLDLTKLRTYILISSSAVYTEKDPQPFKETLIPGENCFWKDYGTAKIAAETTLEKGFENHYIIRPPYLYGPGNNVYREAFIFDCADANRPFYLPEDGSMPLHFFYIDDLCRMIDAILEKQPSIRIYNVGNLVTVTIQEWVDLCYEVAGKQPVYLSVPKEVAYRNYFPFYHYAYCLDVTRQKELLPNLTPLKEGLKASYQWYQSHHDQVQRKPLIQYIEENLE